MAAHSLLDKQDPIQKGPINYRLILLLVLTLHISCLSNTPNNIPKETYLTYANYLKQEETKNKTPTYKAPSHWINLQFKPPLIGKYQLSQSSTLSISTFKGAIGSDEANIKRWQRQIGLTPSDPNKTILTNTSIQDIPTKIVTLQNNTTYLTILWLTLNTKHIFFKVNSNAPINIDPIKLFIEQNTWD
jgi:hypothetical protein